MENNNTLIKKSLVWIILLIIMASYCFLAFQPDLRLSVPSLLGISAIVIILMTVILYCGENFTICLSPGIIILIAALLRLLFLFRQPELSDDIYRYLWDGLQTLQGNNPYAFAPSNAQAANDTAINILKLVNHPDLITIYPPTAQLIFAAGALFKNAIGLKSLLVCMDIGTCFFLIRLLSLRNLPAWKAILYAWHPLPIIEIASSGHIDAAGIFFIFITLLLTGKQSPSAMPANEGPFERFFSKQYLISFLAGICFSMAVLVKLFPLIFLPVLLMVLSKWNRAYFLFGMLSGISVLVLPFLPDLVNMGITLTIYLQNWEFSGFAFRTLRQLTSSGNAARIMLACFFILIATFLYANFWKSKEKSVFNPLYSVTLIFLLLTPTLHPWYVLYLVCFLPFVPGPAGLILSWTVLLSYYVLINYSLLGQWNENNIITAVIWGSPVFAFFLNTIAKKIFRNQAIPSLIK
jgi:hypothetical protein